MFAFLAKHRIIKGFDDTELAIGAVTVLVQPDKSNNHIAATGTHSTGRIDVKIYLVATVHDFRHSVKAAPKTGDQVGFYLLQWQVNCLV